MKRHYFLHDVLRRSPRLAAATGKVSMISLPVSSVYLPERHSSLEVMSFTLFRSWTVSTDNQLDRTYFLVRRFISLSPKARQWYLIVCRPFVSSFSLSNIATTRTWCLWTRREEEKAQQSSFLSLSCWNVSWREPHRSLSDWLAMGWFKLTTTRMLSSLLIQKMKLIWSSSSLSPSRVRPTRLMSSSNMEVRRRALLVASPFFFSRTSRHRSMQRKTVWRWRKLYSSVSLHWSLRWYSTLA